MKRGKTLIIGLVVLCVLGGLYAGITYTKQQADKQAEAAKEAAKTYLTDMDAINYLSYNNNGTALEFEKEDDVWYYVPDHSISLKQDELEKLASDMQKIEILRTLEGGDGLDQYGLSDPSQSVTARDVDGNVQTVLLGNAAGDDIYACLKDKNQAYVISAGLKTDSSKSLKDLTQEAAPSNGETAASAAAPASGETAAP